MTEPAGKNTPAPSTGGEGPLRVDRLLAEGARLLKEGGMEEAPFLEASLLLAHVLKKDRLWLRVHPEHRVEEEAARTFTALLRRRLEGEPVAYLVGKREFYGRDFAVGPGVLVPRPETELLVEAVLDAFPERKKVRFADLGAGSGAIGLTLCLERPSWRGVLLELYPEPLAFAERNSTALGAANALVVRGDMTRTPFASRSLDLVVANPPYIEEDDPGVEKGVRRFEPSSALFSPDKGLFHVEACAGMAARTLAEGGLFAVEHGCGQGEAVRKILERAGFSTFSTIRDLAGLDRIAVGRV